MKETFLWKGLVLLLILCLLAPKKARLTRWAGLIIEAVYLVGNRFFPPTVL